jgi:ankyrin repeat protein
VSLVRLLVNRGAALDHCAKYRLTALMLAVINGHPDIVKLRELHAAMDRAVLDAYGWTEVPTD